ncbi:putative phosphate transport system substrate-binding protein [Calothrix sp. NIES-4071]|nr:putative phosphate transport system substrate-binding protein [Calothrix sp. NIES-4071]
MWQKQKKYSPIVCLALLLALAGTPVAATFLVSQLALAQTEATKEPSFPLPTTIANNTTVKIDGSSSMARINESLKQSFEQKYSGAKVELATNGTDAALKSLVDGNIDLAAISRELTPTEEAQGLEQKRLRREKIAIVVGENNPFKGNITNQQFARMFRGEITNWSEVGGKPGKIRFIDRPNQSDTREALRNYPAFKAGKFATGANATQLSADDTAELVKQLGNDGIGYVIANQVSKVPGLRVLRLHQTLPDDARYPFSQPLVFAYKKNPNPGVAGFLGFATAEPGTTAVEAARSAEAAAVAQSVASGTTATPTATLTPGAEATTQASTNVVATTSPSPEATTDATGTALQAGTTSTGNNQQALASENTQTGGFPWWLLLPLAALAGGILWWLLGKGNKREQALEGASASSIAGASGASINLPQPNSLESTNLVDSTNNTATNLPTGAAIGGAALASTGATGIGLWPRLSNGNIDEPSHNLENENTDVQVAHAPSSDEISVDSTPADVVMPTHSESNIPQVDLEPTASHQAPTSEPIIDVVPSNQQQLPQGGSNQLDNLNAAGAAATGPGLWSQLTNPDNNQPQETTYVANNDFTEIPNTPSIEQTQPNLDLSVANQQPLPDVWEDTEPTQTGSNWFENISQSGTGAIAGGAALASGAAAAGAGLWSQLANRDKNNDNQESEVPPTQPVETNLQTDSIEVSPTSYTPLHQEPEVWEDNSQQQTGSYWLDSIREPSQSVTTGAAALAFDDYNDNQETVPPTQPVETNLQTDSTEVSPTSYTPLHQEPEVLENNSQEQTGSNWLDNIREAFQSITTGGAASSFDDNDNQESEVTPTQPVDTSEIIETISIEPTTPSLGTPLYQEPEVLQDNSLEQTRSSWLDNVQAAPQSEEVGSAVLNNESPSLTNEIVVDSDEQDLVPPTNIDVPEPQPILESSTNEPLVNEIVVDNDEQDLVPPINIDVPEPQPILEANTTEPSVEVEDVATPESDSNLLGIATGAVAVGAAALGTGWLSSHQNDNEPETFNVAEVVDTDNPSSDTQQFDTALTNDTDTSSGILTGDVENRQWWAPSDSDTETTQAEATDITDTSLVNTPSSTPELNINPNVLASGAAVAGIGAAVADYNQENETDATVAPQPPINDVTSTTSSPSTASYITFTARTPKWAYVAWHIDERDKQIKRSNGAVQLALRLYDTHDTDLSYQDPQLVQQYECEETIDDRFVAIPASDRDYMAEIGYLTNDNQWLSIARSNTVRVFSRPHQEFWFEADAELIIHGATEPGSSVTIGGQSVKLKPDGTFHLRIPFTDDLIDYVMTAVAKNGEKAKTIHMHFEQNK